MTRRAPPHRTVVAMPRQGRRAAATMGDCPEHVGCRLVSLPSGATQHVVVTKITPEMVAKRDAAQAAEREAARDG